MEELHGKREREIEKERRDAENTTKEGVICF